MERVVYVAVDLRRSMLYDEIVEYALEHGALVVTRDKGFLHNPRKQRKKDHPSVLLVRHKGVLMKMVEHQIQQAVSTNRSYAARGERVSGVLRRGKFRFRVYPRGKRRKSDSNGFGQ